jgi:MerR family regulatory protein
MTEIRIGELAASTGLTVPTLRYCKELGLLMPDRSTGGNRLRRGARARGPDPLWMVIVGSPPRSRLAAQPIPLSVPQLTRRGAG